MAAVLVRVDERLPGQGVHPVQGVHLREGVFVAVQAVELGVRVGREL